VRQCPGRTGRRVLHLHTAFRKDGADPIGVVEALLTPRLAPQREEDVDQRRDRVAHLLAAAVAREISKPDDQVTHLSSYPIPFIRAGNIRDPLMQNGLHLQDGHHQPVEVESIEDALILSGLGPAWGRGQRRTRTIL
jgi:hypothetical protein